jgi:hypothetical protein
VQKFELFTLNYPKFQPSMGVPIRTSNGFPRYKLSYQLSHAMRELMPSRAIMKLPKPEFTSAYRDGLDAVGLDVIASRFRAIATAEGDERLVIMCFEWLERGDWCHRTIFGEWWEDRTGEKVRELGPTGAAAPADASLFD